MVVIGMIFIAAMTGVSLYFLKQPVMENKAHKLKKHRT
jgi:hypothetical protein